MNSKNISLALATAMMLGHAPQHSPLQQPEPKKHGRKRRRIRVSDPSSHHFAGYAKREKKRRLRERTR